MRYILFTILIILSGCASFDKGSVGVDSIVKQPTIDASNGTIDLLDQLLDQKLINTAKAEQIETLNNSITQNLKLSDKIVEYTKNIQAEEVNYGGAGWVLITAIVFVVIGIALTYVYIKYYRTQKLLKLVTGAVRTAIGYDRSAIQDVKYAINDLTSRDQAFTQKDKWRLKKFTIKHDTHFIKRDPDADL